MARQRPTRSIPAAAAYLPMEAGTVEAACSLLNDAVQAHIGLLERADDGAFTAVWEEATRPTEAFWKAYLLLPLLAFPDDPPPDQRHEAAILLAPAILAPTLAALAFAPGGLRFGRATWQGQHPAARRLIGYGVTDASNGGVLRLAVQSGASIGGWTPLHRRTVQILHLLFPFKAIELLRLPLAERWGAVQRTVASFTPESLLFSEVLSVGGTPAQIGQATDELVMVVAALACAPWGVPTFGYRWEVLPMEPNLGAMGAKLEPVAAEEAAP